MALSEFDLIRRYFAEAGICHPETRLSIGDDCALLSCPPGMELAVTVDTLVADIHFFADVDPESLGHKALAVNLSDLAAMGALSKWCTLALTLPEVDEAWLSAFTQGFLAFAERHGVQLIGGDTTRGPLAITIQAMGLIPRGQALRRSGAKTGDLIYVSGPLGAAGLALKQRLSGQSPGAPSIAAALERPEPRLPLGERLRGLATACIDISDGLAADLGHILEASQVGARVDFERLPLSDFVRRHVEETGDYALPLTAGDDYELCFTVPPAQRMETDALLRQLDLKGSAIGEIVEAPGLRILREGVPLFLETSGHDHFAQVQVH